MAHEGEPAGANDKRNAVKIMYDKVATQHDMIDDFRAKLLALLPVATGIGLFALVKEPSNNIDFLFAMGLFGAIVSFGLFVHELRGITECYMLITIGAALERDLTPETEPRGTFSSRHWWGVAPYVRRKSAAGSNTTPAVNEEVSSYVCRETAALIVYPATIAAWVFVASWPILGPGWSLAPSLFAFAVVVLWGLQTLRRDARKVCRYIAAHDRGRSQGAEEGRSASLRSDRTSSGGAT